MSRARALTLALLLGLHLPVADAQDEDRSAQSVEVIVDVPDHPTFVNLTSDTINADNKTKYPGQTLTTRVRVEDANGLAGMALEFLYLRRDASGNVAVAKHTVPDLGEGRDANATSGLFEDDFSLSPLAAADYTVVAAANGVSASRTFRILDSRPVAKAGVVAEMVLTDSALEVSGHFDVGDKNFGTGPLDKAGVRGLPDVSVRLYRGSTAIEPSTYAAYAIERSGVTRSLSPLNLSATRTTEHAFHTYAENGTGYVRLPFKVELSPDNPSGSHRLSIYESDASGSLGGLLSSAEFRIVDGADLLGASLADATVAPGGAVNVSLAPRPEVANLTWRITDALDASFALGGRLPDEGELTGPETLSILLPRPLSARRELELRLIPWLANGTAGITWKTQLKVADVPTLHAITWSLDSLERGDARFHASNTTSHNLSALLEVSDENWETPADSDAKEVAISVRDWRGGGRDWPKEMARTAALGSLRAVFNVTVPSGEESGRFEVIVSLDGRELESVYLSIGGWTSLRADKERLAARTDDRTTSRLFVEVPLRLEGSLEGKRLDVRFTPNMTAGVGGELSLNGDAVLLGASGERLANATIVRGSTNLTLPPQGVGGELKLLLDLDATRPLRPGRALFTLRLELVPS